MLLGAVEITALRGRMFEPPLLEAEDVPLALFVLPDEERGPLLGCVVPAGLW